MIARLLCLTLLVSACATPKPKAISAYQIKKLYTDFDPQTTRINYGNFFPLTVFAEMKNGQIDTIGDDDQLRVSPPLKVLPTSKVAIILVKPTSFSQDKIPFTLEIGSENGTTRTLNDTLLLNFKDDVVLDYQPKRFLHGERGSSGGLGLLLQDGRSGGNGFDGESGNNGDSYEVYVWKEGTRTFIVCKNTSKNETYKYQVEGDYFIHLTATGEDGGNGGRGGNGNDGKFGQSDGDRSRPPGIGGDGGRGGNGGNGGDGGQIICYIHPNAKDRIDFLKFDVSEGSAGKGGSGGNAGQSGLPDGNQQHPPKGSNGLDGSPGTAGMDGYIERTITPFDFEIYK